MKQVLVIGDSCDDVYIFGHCKRLSPEYPIPVLDKVNNEIHPGMAANVDANLNALGIATNLLTQIEKITKTRFVDINTKQQLLRMDTTPKVTPLTGPEVKMAMIHATYDALVISDYDKGFIGYQELIVLCENFPGPIFVDTKKTKLFQLDNVFWKINEKEFNALDKEKRPNETHLIVTLGSKGVRWGGIIYPAKPVTVFDVCGAGDTFLAVLVYEFLKDNDMKKAVDVANRGAAITVQHPGTYKLTKKDLESLF